MVAPAFVGRVVSVILIAPLALGSCASPGDGEDSTASIEQGALGTPPTVTVPAIATSSTTGMLPAQADVGPDGVFRYRIPIAVPEGRAGMTPRIALEYSSTGPDEVMGPGWSLRGVSMISRCPKTRAQHLVPDRINFNAADAYCLDGQPLALISGTAGTANAIYRPEIET